MRFWLWPLEDASREHKQQQGVRVGCGSRTFFLAGEFAGRHFLCGIIAAITISLWDCSGLDAGLGGKARGISLAGLFRPPADGSEIYEREGTCDQSGPVCFVLRLMDQRFMM
jgi:hypothetical protein